MHHFSPTAHDMINIVGELICDMKALDFVVVLFLLGLVVYQVQRRSRGKSTNLPGPPPKSRIFGMSEEIFNAEDSAVMFEEWSEKYGPVFRIPLALGSSRVLLCDPKAANYFYSRETTSFLATQMAKKLIETMFGKGLIWAEGESHRRQRKTLTPAFSIQAIRDHTHVFFDSAYKLKSAWDTTLTMNDGEALIDVQTWMNKVSLDSIGVAGFSHDFGTLQGRHSAVAEVFDSFTRLESGRNSIIPLLLFMITPILPILALIPTSRMRTIWKLNEVMEQILEDLRTRTRKENITNHVGSGKGVKSIIEALILAESAETGLTLSESEVLAQMKVLILAGYETTSISLTWALINLSLNPNIQDKLRAELSQLNTDPTFDQLTNSLPYLDAVVKETLRLHPPVGETIRVAATDEVIPLGVPLTTRDGNVVDRIQIAAGTTVGVPIRLINRSRAIWGENAKEFLPSRWGSSLAGLPDRAQEIHGPSHLFTFVDGPRTCIGKQFALTEFKAVLSTLIRNYQFSLPKGTDTKFEKVVGILPRPRVVGEEGSRVPLLVRRVE